jgi:hypothetical protein
MNRKIAIFVILILMMLLTSCIEIPVSQVDNITVNWQPKEAFYVGEELYLDTITLTATLSNGRVETYSLSNTSVSVTGGSHIFNGRLVLDTRESKDYTISISYGGVVVTLVYSVYDAIVETTGVKFPYNTIPEGCTILEGRPIQTAINCVLGNNRIRINEGNYNETKDDKDGIIINKGVHIIAADNVTYAPDTEYAFFITGTGDAVTISNMRISDTWTIGAIIQIDSSNRSLNIIDNHISALPRISAANSIQIFGDDSKIIGNTIYVAEQPQGQFYVSSGIYVDADKVDIMNNTIIRQVGSSSGSVGIAVMGNDNNRIAGNIFVGGMKAIDCWYTSNNLEVTGNTFIDLNEILVFDGHDVIHFSNNHFINTFFDHFEVIRYYGYRLDFETLIAQNTFEGFELSGDPNDWLLLGTKNES